MPTRITNIWTYKGRDIKWNQRVEVYRNLNKKGVVYSVKQNGFVVGHTSFIDLKDCYFVVQEAGRKRALKTGRKNVHAFVVGYPVGICTDNDLRKLGESHKGRYDMAGRGLFVLETDDGWDPVLSAMRVRLDGAGMTVWMPRA